MQGGLIARKVSVCQMLGLWHNGRKICPDFFIPYERSFSLVQPGSGSNIYNAILNCSSINLLILIRLLSCLDQRHLTPDWDRILARGKLPQPGANQHVVLAAGAGVNPKLLGRIEVGWQGGLWASVHPLAIDRLSWNGGKSGRPGQPRCERGVRIKLDNWPLTPLH